MKDIVIELHEGIKFRRCTDHNYFPHLHNEVELIFVFEGSFKATCNGQDYVVSAGNVFVAAPEVIHSYESPMESCKTLLLIVNPNLLSGVAARLVDSAPSCPVWQGNAAKNLVWDIVQYAFEEKESLHPENFVEMISLAVSLVIGEMKLVSTRRSNSTEQRILKFCSTHYLEPVTLTEVAGAVGVSERYVSRIFRDKFKISFPKFITYLRLDYAVELLREGKFKIIEIANRSGFSSLSSFNHKFVERYQMTPSQFRKEHGSTKNA